MRTQFPSGWKSTDRRPAVVLFYGGGWKERWNVLYDGYADHLASIGLVVLRPDFRVGKVEDCIEDAKSAVRYVRAHAAELGVDPARIIASGGSSGGHMAVCTGVLDGFETSGEDLAVSSKPDLLMVLCPVLELTNPESDTGRAMSPARAEAASPMLNLHGKQVPPTLIMVAENDGLVRQCRAYQQLAKDLGFKCELKVAPAGGHGFFVEEPGQSAAFGWSDDFLRRSGYLPVP
jgi:acetyl esterase/lipase